MNNKPIIIISGPTASGKTGTSIALAKKVQQDLQKPPVIVNFDSLLFYRELNIGTAKPTANEMSDIQHEMIDICSISTPLNASEYRVKALPIINTIHEAGKIPILVGGSGFYLRALVKGMYESCDADPVIRNEVQEQFNNEGIKPFLLELKENDPTSFDRLHENDHYRILRAIEHFRSTGSPFSEQRKVFEDKKPYDLDKNDLAWSIHNIYLDIPKEQHWDIIEKRTRSMLDEGLINEVQTLRNNGFTGDEKPLNSIGYKEAQLFLKNEIKSEEELIERISISTRQLAKSQRTFFNKIVPSIRYNSLNDLEKITQESIEFLQKH